MTGTVQHYSSVNAVRAALRSAGSHFFDRGAMRTFHSRLEPGGMIRRTFFITSEQIEHSDGTMSARTYSVRYITLHSNGALNVDTLAAPLGDDGWRGFATLADARAAAESVDIDSLGGTR